MISMNTTQLSEVGSLIRFQVRAKRADPKIKSERVSIFNRSTVFRREDPRMRPALERIRNLFLQERGAL